MEHQKMISLTAFRQNLLLLARIMATTGMYTDVAYKGKLYRITMEDLHTPVKLKRRKRTADLSLEIKAERCKECKTIVINGVCMSKKCPSNLRPIIGAKARRTVQALELQK